MRRRSPTLLVCAWLLAACAGPAPTLGDLGQPAAAIASIPDAVPKPEPLSKYGNPDRYEVLGSEYFVLASARGFTQTGSASWYGRNFHGNRTSSGEIYDMYKMTAAHKRLPLPTYLRVTNLANGREVVVKVNDRGPFHSNRIIDVSYAAAVQLGMIEEGTAKVKIEAIVSDTERVGNPGDPKLYLQTGAFAQSDNAYSLAQRMKQMGLTRVFVEPGNGQRGLYRVKVGPFEDSAQLAAARRTLEEGGIKPNTLRN